MSMPAVSRRSSRCAAHEPPLALASLMEEALALWTGPAFGSEADLPLVRAEAIRLEERRGAARQTLAAALLAGNRAADATAEAEALVTDEPLREGAWSVLVTALAAEGRAADALRAYQRAASLLAEAGLDPSEHLRAAERQALEGSSPLSAPTGPTPTRTPAPSVLRRPPPPRRTSSFVGRSADLDHVEELLDEGRVVTLVGPGGVGKTRLALEIAARRGPTLRHGVAWVDLAPLPEDSSVRDQVTAAVDPSGPATSADAGIDADHLELLVVLDNAEHVLDSTCEVVGSLIDAGTGVQVLVTSRERLGTESERVVPVTPLAADGPGSPGRRLLLDRVEASGSAVHLDPDDDRVGALLARLDGLPLAIEMAAAQLATTSLDELVEAVSRRSTDIDPLPRGVPDRHRSLAAVLDWSERRLDPEERTLLTEMSVFAGSLPVVDIEAALDRAGSATAVRRLVERSLVVADLTDSPARYGLLQTVRDHGRDRLRDPRRARRAQWSPRPVVRRRDEEGGTASARPRRRPRPSAAGPAAPRAPELVRLGPYPPPDAGRRPGHGALRPRPCGPTHRAAPVGRGPARRRRRSRAGGPGRRRGPRPGSGRSGPGPPSGRRGPRHRWPPSLRRPRCPRRRRPVRGCAAVGPRLLRAHARRRRGRW